MDQKTKFTRTGYYHMLVAVLMAALVVDILFQGINTPILIACALMLGIAYLVGWAGWHARNADRRALIILIVFNALQVVAFHTQQIRYDFVLGPFIQIGLPEGTIAFGIKNEMEVGYNAWRTASGYFSFSLIHAAFLFYLLDQIRFVPKQKDQPWEADFAENTEA